MSKDLIHQNNSTPAGVTKKLDLSSINQKSLAGALAKVELPRLFYQLVIFVLDASESMTWEGLTGRSKGEEMGAQLPQIVERLKTSKNKNCFDLSMIAFSSSTNHFLPPTNITNIDLNGVDLNPCTKVGNYQTFMEDALLKSESIINQYFSEHKDHSQALLIILTDGDLNDYEKSLEIAERIKQNSRASISSCLFEDKNWNEKLDDDSLERIRQNVQSLSSQSPSGERFFVSKIDAEEIRKHMLKSISTISKVD
jgi:uncharacterized protein YegL